MYTFAIFYYNACTFVSDHRSVFHYDPPFRGNDKAV